MRLALCFSLGMLVLPGAASGASLLFNGLETGSPLDEPIAEFAEYEVWRHREVSIDLNALYETAEPAAPDPSIRLNLFDDAVYQARFLDLDSVPDVGAEVWTGIVEGRMGPGTAVFVVDGEGRILGNVRVDGELFHFLYDEQTGDHHLVQLNPDFRLGGVPDCLGPRPATDDGFTVFAMPAEAAPLAAGGEETHTITVKIVHDAVISGGWFFGLQAAAAVHEANTMLAIQGNRARFEIGGLLPSDYIASGNMKDVDLPWLTTSSYATTNRGTADLVVLVVASGDACGYGFIGDGQARKDSRFTSVVRRDCMVTNLTLPHELGHNLSACHDRYIGDCPSGFDGDRHGFIVTWTELGSCPWYKPDGFLQGNPRRPERACI